MTGALRHLGARVHGLLRRRPTRRRSRALAKTVSYRVLMVVVTVTVALAITGSVREAASIGLVANLIKTGTYYGHERLWDRVSWGVRS